MRQKMQELNGLRTLAILFVAIGHYSQFWTPSGDGIALLPYGDALYWPLLGGLGGLGVELFFIISGFLIALSLTRSGTFGAYAALRLIRLWPTVLFCGALTFAATTLIGPPELVRTPAEAAISMAFLPPQHVGKLLGHTEWQWLDGAYWSLWTQVRFFAVMGLIYFFLDRGLTRAWTVFALVGLVSQSLAFQGNALADAIAGLLFAPHHPYFTAGLGMALALSAQTRIVGIAFVLFALIQAQAYAAAYDFSSFRHAMEIVVFSLVATVVFLPGKLAVLGWTPIATMGQASFIFYLLHQHFGLSLVRQLPEMGTVPSLLATVAILTGIALFSVWAMRNLERPMNAWLRDAALGRRQEPIRVV